MKVTTGPMLLLITVGGLIVYLGQKYFEGATAHPPTPAYAQVAAPLGGVSPLPAFCTQDEPALVQREAAVATVKAQQVGQSAEFDRRLSEIIQREADLNARQAGMEAREAELVKGQSELAQGWVTFELERTTFKEEKGRLAQEEQRLNNLKTDLDGSAAQLAQWESALYSERIKLDEEWRLVRSQQDEFQFLLWVLYGLITVTTTVLLALVWLAYRLIRPSSPPENRPQEDSKVEILHPTHLPGRNAKRGKEPAPDWPFTKPIQALDRTLRALP